MADITVGGKGFEGIVATFKPKCVTNMQITSDSNWVTFSIDTNTVNAIVKELPSGENERTANARISFTAITENEVVCDPIDFTIKQIKSGESCKFPGEQIQIMLTGLTSSYEYYVLTDEVIGVNCTDWIKSSGQKYFPSDVGLLLGYYQYQGCTFTQYDSGENYYCDIITPGSSPCTGENKSLFPNGVYHLYGFDGNSFREIRIVTMPDGDTAQNKADDAKICRV